MLGRTGHTCSNTKTAGEPKRRGPEKIKWLEKSGNFQYNVCGKHNYVKYSRIFHGTVSNNFFMNNFDLLFCDLLVVFLSNCKVKIKTCY